VFSKDPHVRVAGEPESVRAAKERIMAVLDTRVKKIAFVVARCFILIVLESLGLVTSTHLT